MVDEFNILSLRSVRLTPCRQLLIESGITSFWTDCLSVSSEVPKLALCDLFRSSRITNLVSGFCFQINCFALAEKLLLFFIPCFWLE